MLRDFGLLLLAHFFHCGPLYDPAKLFVGRDLFLNYYPIHWYFADRIRSGELPFWNPYLNLGISFWADPVNAVLYPPRWLLVFFGNTYAGVSLLTALHFLLAQFLFYGFMKCMKVPGLAAVTASIMYSAGGYLTMEGTAHQFLYAHSWAPGLAWAAVEYCRGRAWGLWAASISSSMILLAGEPQTFVVAAPVAILGIGYFRKNLKAFIQAGIAIGVLPFLLWMPVFLPMLLFAAETTRAQVHHLSSAEQWSLGPLRLLDLFVPFLFGECVSGYSCWTKEGAGYSDSFYMGAAAIPVIAAGLIWGSRRKETAFWCLLAMLSLLIAAGEYLPFYGWLYRFLPGWSLFRYPERMIWPAVFGLSSAAGLSLLTLREVPKRYRVLLFLLTLTVVADIAAGNLREILDAYAGPKLGHFGPAVISRSCGWALAALAAYWLWVSLAHRISPNWYLGLMAATFILDVPGITRNTFRTVPAGTLDVTPAAVLAEMQRPAEDDPVPPLHYSDPRNLTRGIPVENVYGPGRQLPISQFSRTVYTIQTLEGGMSARYRMGTVWGPSDISFSHNLYRYIRYLPLAKATQFFGIRYLTVHRDFPATANGTLSLASAGPPNSFGYQAYIYTGETSPVVCPGSTGYGTTFEKLFEAVSANPAVIHEKAMFLAEARPAEPEISGDTGKAEICEVQSWSPEAVSIRVRSGSPRWMVYRRSFTKGWVATMDGRPASILAAYGIFPAIPVGPGEHVIRLQYEPPRWKAGAAIALISLAGLMAWGRRLMRAPQTAQLPDSDS